MDAQGDMNQRDGSPGRAGVASPTGGVFSATLSKDEFASELERCRRTLWTIAAAVLNNRSAAEDCLQEAALVAMGKLAEFDRGTSFAAWMGQIVRFVALNEGRKRQRQRAVSLEHHGDDQHSGQSGREGKLASAIGFDERVSRALESLDDTARSCLLLRTVQDLPYSEIAVALGIPEGTAMSHVHRARQHLRERLSEASARAEERGRA